MVEGYHLFVGGGYGEEKGIARELLRNIAASDLPAKVEQLIRIYLSRRNENENFRDYVLRQPTEKLLEGLTDGAFGCLVSAA